MEKHELMDVWELNQKGLDWDYAMSRHLPAPTAWSAVLIGVPPTMHLKVPEQAAVPSAANKGLQTDVSSLFGYCSKSTLACEWACIGGWEGRLVSGEGDGGQGREE